MTQGMPARRFWNDAWKSSSGSSSGRERGIARELERARWTAGTATSGFPTTASQTNSDSTFPVPEYWHGPGHQE
jgi:hypothetical protein